MSILSLLVIATVGAPGGVATSSVGASTEPKPNTYDLVAPPPSNAPPPAAVQMEATESESQNIVPILMAPVLGAGVGALVGLSPAAFLRLLRGSGPNTRSVVLGASLGAIAGAAAGTVVGLAVWLGNSAPSSAASPPLTSPDVSVVPVAALDSEGALALGLGIQVSRF